MRLGARIGKARNEVGLSRQGLAEAVGRSVHAVRKWESDEHEPSLAMLQQIAEVTGVSVSYLVGGSSEGDLTEVARARAALAGIERRAELVEQAGAGDGTALVAQAQLPQPKPHHPGVAALAASELYRREYDVSDEELDMLRTCLIRRGDGGHVVISTMQGAIALLEAIRQMVVSVAEPR